ncbi:MAG: M48 family metallopeptidase [Myxococcota bacterium]
MREHWRRGIAGFALLGVLGACGTLSVQDEKRLGHRVQRQVREQFQLLREPVVVQYVREVGARVAAAAQSSAFEFRFYVIEDESINAFAIPGGAVYVHTGLITSAHNEAELAGVLAHEIGHVTARHVAKLYKRQRNTGLLAQIVAVAIAIVSGNSYIAQGGALATDVAATAYLNTYTQDAEREADQLAVDTLIRAGYDPRALITMFQTLQAEVGSGVPLPQILKSHPATAERIRNVQYLIRQHEPLPQDLRTDSRKLPIIQERIKLIVGMDVDGTLEPE